MDGGDVITFLFSSKLPEVMFKVLKIHYNMETSSSFYFVLCTLDPSIRPSVRAVGPSVHPSIHPSIHPSTHPHTVVLFLGRKVQERINLRFGNVLSQFVLHTHIK